MNIESFSEQAIPSIEDPDEAIEFIEDLYEKGERPVVTVPRRYLEELQTGLNAYQTWIGVPLIAATMGREPYLPEDNSEERIQVNIKRIDVSKIHPRFTGPDESFHGVVILDGPISPEDIEVVN